MLVLCGRRSRPYHYEHDETFNKVPTKQVNKPEWKHFICGTKAKPRSSKYKNKIIIAEHCKQLTRIVRWNLTRLRSSSLDKVYTVNCSIEPMHSHICFSSFSFVYFSSFVLAMRYWISQICVHFEESRLPQRAAQCALCKVHCGNITQWKMLTEFFRVHQ